MTATRSLRRWISPNYRRFPFKLGRIFLWFWYTKEIWKMIYRSELGRIFWVLEYMEDTLGGHASFVGKLPVNKYKRPLPWYTYPAIEYLQQLDFSKSNVFEYGSGNSSKFWSALAHSVTSVEISPHWYERGIQALSSNQILLLRTEIDAYVNAIQDNDSPYDVIVIDGAYRYNCAVESLQRIANGGIIILDNADWYPNTTKLLRDGGLTQVDFIGAGPINSYASCTSIFLTKQADLPRTPTNATVTVLGGLRQVADHDRYVDGKLQSAKQPSREESHKSNTP